MIEEPVGKLAPFVGAGASGITFHVEAARRSGQRFIPATWRKLAAARELIGDREIALAVDGGVTRDNVDDVVSSGVDLVVAGSAVFDGGDSEGNARALLNAVVAGAPMSP
jgi:pentose-5-phosphate-3-epimerase